jgi:hypothetical protein
MIDRYGHIEGAWDRIIAAKQRLHAETTARLRPHFDKWADGLLASEAAPCRPKQAAPCRPKQAEPCQPEGKTT